jgi:hypothetical protein
MRTALKERSIYRLEFPRRRTEAHRCKVRIQVDERVLGFQTERIVQTTFCQALEKLTDSDLGWRMMTQIYERELRAN